MAKACTPEESLQEVLFSRWVITQNGLAERGFLGPKPQFPSRPNRQFEDSMSYHM